MGRGCFCDPRKKVVGPSRKYVPSPFVLVGRFPGPDSPLTDCQRRTRRGPGLEEGCCERRITNYSWSPSGEALPGRLPPGTEGNRPTDRRRTFVNCTHNFVFLRLPCFVRACVRASNINLDKKNRPTDGRRKIIFFAHNPVLFKT